MDASGVQHGLGRNPEDRSVEGNRGLVLTRRTFLGVLLAAPALVRAHPAPAPAPIKDAELAALIARRHRVALPAAEFVVRLANVHFPENPELLLALIAVESHYNVWCRGSAGEVGLCQIRPDFHGASAVDLIDPEANVKTAARILRENIRAAGSIEGGLRRYNGTGEAAERYAARVLAERGRLGAIASANP